LGSLGEIREVAYIFRPLYLTVMFMHQFWQNMVWDTFWAIFIETHLVTLLRSQRPLHVQGDAGHPG
jgi:hypothetical protein